MQTTQGQKLNAKLKDRSSILEAGNLPCDSFAGHQQEKQ
jgi:hypothetical protein